VIHEDTHSFSGKWPQLQGKMVRIIWVEPTADASQTTSGDAKRKFAKSVFVEAFKEQSSAPQPPGGVVIIFDSADGGQVSVSISNLAQWQAGQLSEDSFWKQCLVEPPEMFQSAQTLRFVRSRSMTSIQFNHLEQIHCRILAGGWPTLLRSFYDETHVVARIPL
jgi:hypothetical protein